jgi:hypothetical protein
VPLNNKQTNKQIASLQAFVYEIKDDASGDGDLESDVEQVSEAPSAFFRSLPSYMKQIQAIRLQINRLLDSK